MYGFFGILNQGVDARPDGGVIRVKALLGVCAILFFFIPQFNSDDTLKENQLYVFDPKALHHIVVKVGFCYIYS